MSNQRHSWCSLLFVGANRLLPFILAGQFVFVAPAGAYCWTRSEPDVVARLQAEVERDPQAAIRQADTKLGRLEDGKRDPELGAWLYAIKAAASYQLNGSETVKEAASNGLRLLNGRPAPAETNLRLAVLNSTNTPEDMQRAIAQFDALERSSTSSQARICIITQRGLTHADLMQVQPALIDLTSAYAQAEDLPASLASLRAHSATALASVLSRRGLAEIASPLYESALAIYKRQGATFDILTNYIRQGLAKSGDREAQAQAAINDFQSLLSHPRIGLISPDILTVVQAQLCQSYTNAGQLDLADKACAASERLLHSKQTPTWFVLYAPNANLALKRQQHKQALAYLDKAAKWRFGAPLARELDVRAKAYAGLGQLDKALPLLTDYVALVRKQDREDRTFLSDAWRARVFALEKEKERLELGRNHQVTREPEDAQRKRAILIAAASVAIIALLLAIVLITRRARARTIRLTDDIQRQAKEKIRMVAHLSHEIRSPPGSMTLVARTLRTRAQASDEEKGLLSRMDRNGARISRLLSDMLDYSRIEAGQLSLKPREVALRPLLAEVVDPHRTQAGQRGLTLDLAIEDQVPDKLWCDGERLFQVPRQSRAQCHPLYR